MTDDRDPREGEQPHDADPYGQETDGLDLGTEWLLSQLKADATGQLPVVADGGDADGDVADGDDTGDGIGDELGADEARQEPRRDDESDTAPDAGTVSGADADTTATEDSGLLARPAKARQTWVPPEEPRADLAGIVGLPAEAAGAQTPPAEPADDGPSPEHTEHDPLPADETLSMPVVGSASMLPVAAPSPPVPAGADADPEPQPELAPWWSKSREAPSGTDDDGTGDDRTDDDGAETRADAGHNDERIFRRPSARSGAQRTPAAPVEAPEPSGEREVAAESGARTEQADIAPEPVEPLVEPATDVTSIPIISNPLDPAPPRRRAADVTPEVEPEAEAGVESEPDGEAEAEPESEQDARDAQPPSEPEPRAVPERSDGSPANETADVFVWSLTPNDELDPVVHEADEPPFTAQEGHEPAPSVPEPIQQAAPLASAVPPAIDTPAEPEGTEAVPESTRAEPEGTEAVPESTRAEPEGTEAVPESTRAEPESTEAESDDGGWLLSADYEADSESTQLIDTVTPGTDEPQNNAAGAETTAAETTAAETTAAETTETDTETETETTRADAQTRLLDMSAGAAESRAAHTDAVRGVTGDAASAAQPPAPAIGGPATPAPMDPAPAGSSPAAGVRRAGGSNGPPRALIWAALALIAVLVLVGLFYLGTRIPLLFAAPAPAPTVSAPASATSAPTPIPTAVEPAAGPATPGEHEWTALRGGECLEPYTTPWAERFTVVDCAVPHSAQMTYAAPVNPDPAAAYPGEGAIAAQIYLWCSSPDHIDLQATSAYTDIQVQGTYPVNEEQWNEGLRNYYCFVSRSSGEPLTGSLAVPVAA
ncbi:hypothetical protein GCM10027416_32100 [Okibacterium endophyticum]